MLRYLIPGLLSLALISSPAMAKDFGQTTGTAPDGTRYYQDSVEIDSPAAKLWRAFTDQVAYRAWAAPVSSIDFRIGGTVEASYDPHGHLGDPQNIKQSIVAYLPERLLVFRNTQAPDGLPGKEVYGQTIKTHEFNPLGPSRTRVTISGVGFGDGPAFDQLYRFFADGDGNMLLGLKHAYESGKP